MCLMIRPLSFLRDQLTVEALDDDQVSVTVVIPADLLNSYCHLIDSLYGFFREANRRSKIARALSKASCGPDPDGQARIAQYRDLLFKSFEKYTTKGLDRDSALKAIRDDLRATGHPWSNLFLIRDVLVDRGRGPAALPRGRKKK